MDMTVLSTWTSFFFKLFLAFASFWLLSSQLPADTIFNRVDGRRTTVCILASLFMVFLDSLVIWPFFRSPLRKLPTILAGPIEMNAITFENPRGKTVLEWMNKFPEADIIHANGGLGDSVLVPISPNAFREILSSTTYEYQKPWALRNVLAPMIGWGLVLAEEEEHRKQRKALTPAFSLRNIRGNYPLMWMKTAHFLDKIGDEVKKQGFVEMTSWASKLTLDIIGHAALSRDFQAMDTPNHKVSESFTHILEPSLALLVHFFLAFFIPHWLLSKFPLETNRILQYHSGVLRETCDEILQDKKAVLGKKSSGKTGVEKEGEGYKRVTAEDSDDEEVDIMKDIIESGSFSDTEIVDQMLTFLAAGHETTANAISWCCYLLATHKDIQERLRAEVRANVSSIALNPTEQVTFQTFESLPYLHGVCEETLRLYPTVPLTMREVVRDTTVTDVFVPKGTDIIIVPYAINRNPRFWGADANEMRPERWINVSADGVETPNKHGGTENNMTNMTFLHGNRSCIGRDFAKAELRCAVAAVFQRYEVSLWDPSEEIKVAGTITAKPSCSMKLILKEISSR